MCNPSVGEIGLQCRTLVVFGLCPPRGARGLTLCVAVAPLSCVQALSCVRVGKTVLDGMLRCCCCRDWLQPVPGSGGAVELRIVCVRSGFVFLLPISAFSSAERPRSVTVVKQCNEGFGGSLEDILTGPHLKKFFGYATGKLAWQTRLNFLSGAHNGVQLNGLWGRVSCSSSCRSNA